VLVIVLTPESGRELLLSLLAKLIHVAPWFLVFGLAVPIPAVLAWSGGFKVSNVEGGQTSQE
jgi:hypothetical protein